MRPSKHKTQNFCKLVIQSHSDNIVSLQAQSWTALFRAFSSHRQPSAIFSKAYPAEQTSWPNWQTLLACREADGLVGNKRFFHLWYFRNK